MLKFLTIAGLFCVFISFVSCSSSEQIALIPKPQMMELGSGHFVLDSTIQVVSDLSTDELGSSLAQLNEILGWSFELALKKQVNTASSFKRIHFELDESNQTAEGYSLEISRSGIHLKANKEAGFHNALNTLGQILTLSLKPKTLSQKSDVQHSSIQLPILKIEDSPKFQWRGLMLDCSRTFIPIPELKKYIDLLALYKMNVLHLHLTDDQGWRLEIKKYPELTKLCSESDPKYTNDKGGYYSQLEMKDLIDFAAQRNVTIVPEIEMPGHSSEIFAAFPELSCTGKKTKIYPFFSGPGITDDILCAGKEEVFIFVENVLEEVCNLFPSEYIHIGGDEAPKVRWDNCEDCQARIQTEGLHNSHELQSYFIQRVEKMLEARGKKLIGWDEILEGGLAENAAVMSWRGIQGGIEAAQAGHPVVMSPTSHCYFDYSHGTTSVQEVYEFNPIPEEIDQDQAHFILGGQANFWSHIDRQSFAMQRQIFPRIIALSEKLWSGENSTYENFESRLIHHYPVLDSLGINFYEPSKIIEPNDSLDFAGMLNLEGYSFDFHGFKGAEFNYQGMACKVVIPNSVADGHPWIWRARFWGHEPQLDIALLDLGYHVVYCDVVNLFGNEVAVNHWNKFYALMQKGGLAKKGVLEGMSRGGLIIYNWALANPDKVSAIYADAPVLDGTSWPGGFGTGKGSPSDWARFKKAYQINSKQDSLNFIGDPIHQAKAIAQLGIPLIHVCVAMQM